MQTELSRVQEALRSAGRVLLTCHVNPDGDAVGSLVALAHIAQDMDCDVRLIFFSPLPDFLNWLPLPAPTVSQLSELGEWVPDLVIFADCGDADRAGSELAAVALKRPPLPAEDWQNVRTVNIDHHRSNPGFADINWVEPERSATGELVGMLAESLDIALGGNLGVSLYMAIASDTGNFTYSNTSSDCLALASRIVDAGLDVGRFTERFENNWSIGRMHLWGRLMSEIELHEDGAVSLCVVPRRYFDEFGLDKAALDGFASLLRRLRGVRVGIFIREDAPGLCKVSLRSMGDVDVQAVAALFGGGGHKAAAGADLRMESDEAAREVLAKVRERL